MDKINVNVNKIERERERETMNTDEAIPSNPQKGLLGLLSQNYIHKSFDDRKPLPTINMTLHYMIIIT